MNRLKKIFKLIKKYFNKNKWWENILLIIGSLSVIIIISMIFLPISSGPRDVEVAGSVPESTSNLFLPTLSHSLNLPQDRGGNIEILNNGDEFMESLLNDIDNAQSSINMMTFIWADGKMSDEILNHLYLKLDEGVEVRIIRDGVGGSFASLDKFKKKGGKVYNFHAVDLAPWNLLRLNQRNHRRSIVIDGKIGYLGGAAIEDHWLGNAENEDQIRDMMFRVKGSMASYLQGTFSEIWSGSGELIAGEKFYSSQEKNDEGEVAYISLSSSPTPDILNLENFLLFSFLSAKNKIYITTPYLILDRPLTEVLINKSKEGLDIQIMVPSKNTDMKAVRQASHYSYNELLESGIRIFEYQPNFLHSKFLTIDDSWSIIGSANMDNRSRTINQENVFGVSSFDFAKQLETTFNNDLTKSKEITLDEWKERSAWKKLREFFARKFVQQY